MLYANSLEDIGTTEGAGCEGLLARWAWAKVAARQEDYITLKQGQMNIRHQKKWKVTFRSKQTTHSVDWKVSTGAEGSVSSGAEGASPLFLSSSSSEGALAAPFCKPVIIHFNFSLHTRMTLKTLSWLLNMRIIIEKLPAPPSRLLLAESSPVARPVMAERTRLRKNSLEIPICCDNKFSTWLCWNRIKDQRFKVKIVKYLL